LSASYAAVATQAALRAGGIQKAKYGQEIEVRKKGEIDLVTEVDRACEDAILETIRARFPDHDIVTEETALPRRGSPFVWYVDPLDGTTNFAHRYPFFCSSVALAKDGVVIAGAVYDPLKEELFTGERGAGAHLNGKRLHVSSAASLLESLLLTGFPYDLRDDVEGHLRSFNRLMAHARAIRRDGAAALDLSYVAAGRADGFWEGRLNAWDFAAGLLFVEEAGGRATRFDGRPVPLVADEVAATNGHIHDLLLEVVESLPKRS
jgi:myo-inositol-1(or 4)-monophosphatase